VQRRRRRGDHDRDGVVDCYALEALRDRTAGYLSWEDLERFACLKDFGGEVVEVCVEAFKSL
jgi:hypothetical protein